MCFYGKTKCNKGAGGPLGRIVIERDTYRIKNNEVVLDPGSTVVDREFSGNRLFICT